MRDIYIIDNTETTLNILKELFHKEKDYEFTSLRTDEIDVVLRNIPDMIIIDEDTIGVDIIDVCKILRQDEDNSITPIIVISSNWDKDHRLDILKQYVEYYIVKPIEKEYIYYTIKNLIRLLQVNRRVSPLTGLPGNVQIQTEMKRRLLNKENFAILYFDLDNFKAYNDIYGFANGDEIIKFTARTIVDNIHSADSKDNFIGHIGGDDFIAISTADDYDKMCKKIISDFDENVLQYYNKEDIEKGYIEVANRKGIIEQFPLTSISIGVVVVEPGRFRNTLEIGEVGAQVKHQAKSISGSTYVINRRRK